MEASSGTWPAVTFVVCHVQKQVQKNIDGSIIGASK
jgi:hypothetical protein